jgi:2,5-diamino-6-(ribosylamino)-4(3H)-pyrimidinone 5'-phosphate reductase
MEISERPYTTLFMLTSVDGKISSGATDNLDVDTDWKRIVGVREGLKQYYDLEQETDLFSLNSGRTWAKVGYNEYQDEPVKTPVSFVIIDSNPHLDINGVRYAAKKAKNLIVVTTNPNHSAFKLKNEFQNISVLQYANNIDFSDMFRRLKLKFGVERITIQTGSTLNADFLRFGLVDRLLVVMAPILVGGISTPSLIGGASILKTSELSSLKPMKLISCKTLSNSYLQLEYEILRETVLI